jgi:hypothetical protein
MEQPPTAAIAKSDSNQTTSRYIGANEDGGQTALASSKSTFSTVTVEPKPTQPQNQRTEWGKRHAGSELVDLTIRTVLPFIEQQYEQTAAAPAM